MFIPPMKNGHTSGPKESSQGLCLCMFDIGTLPSTLFCLNLDCLSLCANSDMPFSHFTVFSQSFWVSPCSRAVVVSDGVLAQIKASWLGHCSPSLSSEGASADFRLLVSAAIGAVNYNQEQSDEHTHTSASVHTHKHFIPLTDVTDFILKKLCLLCPINNPQRKLLKLLDLA